MRLIFCAGYSIGPYAKRHGLRGLWWLVTRQPRIAYQMVGSSIVTRLSGWSASHVMITSGDATLDYQYTRTRFWPALAAETQDRVIGITDTPGLPDLTRWEGRQCGSWTGLLCTTVAFWVLWITRGTMRVRPDCISVAIDILSEVGISVPQDVWTPSQLRDHLHEQGYPYVPVDSAAADSEATHRGT